MDNRHKRIYWVDLLRFISILMVICVHCSDPFNVSPEARSNPEYNFWGAVYGSLLRPCVPLFVIITGLLLIPTSISMEEFYKKRLLRIMIPFIIWSVLYNLFPWFTGILGFSSNILSQTFAYVSGDASQSFTDAVTSIIKIPLEFNSYTIPMWYMYMLIGLYLYIPIFSPWIKSASVKEKKIVLVIWFCTLFLPYIHRFYSSSVLGFSAWNEFDTFHYLSGFSGYLLLGYFLANDITNLPWSKKILFSSTLFTIGYSITFIGFKTMTADPYCTENDMELFFLYCSPNVMMMTVAIVFIVKDVQINSQSLQKILTNISTCGLGIYLIHYFIVGFGYSVADLLSIPIAIKIPVTAIFVFICSWVIVAFFYKMTPKISKYIFG